jgi:hypothetical protein
MNIFLPKPPLVTNADEYQKWLDTLHFYLIPSVEKSGDTASTISDGTTYHGVTALTAARAKTLPLAKNYLKGLPLVIQDESGAAGTHNITISRAGSDTINGATSVTISTNYGRRVLFATGATTWFSA